ncbi:anaphase-promoting complex subunit 4 isoform X2 [Lycorma delicatula]
MESEVTCLYWVQEKETQDSTGNTSAASGQLQDATSDFLPKLPSLSRSFGSINEGMEENLEDAKKIKDQSQLNFLLVGLNNGQINLSIFGLFPCGTIDAKELLNVDQCSIVDAELSKDLKVLLLAVKVHNFLKILILDTRILSSRSRELHALALKHGHIISLLDYLSHTMQSITEAWENILLLEMESKLTSYAESMPEGSVSADFLELLMFGIASEPLERFLVHDLTDKGIKKLGHSIELSHSNIQKLILKHLHSVGQNIAYHLAELKGMARLTDRFNILGLDEDVVATSFTAAGSFLVKANEMLLVIDDSMKKYKSFFRWFYAVILRMSDDRIPDLTLTDVNQQDLAFIANYLYTLDGINKTKIKDISNPQKKCWLDRLGQYLVDEELVNPPDLSKNAWEKLLHENPCLLNHPSIIPRNDKTSLVQQHNRLKKDIDNVFKAPKHAIGSLFQLHHTVPLVDFRADLQLSMIHLCIEQKLLVAILQTDNLTQFKFFDIPVEEPNGFKMVHLCFNPPETIDGPRIPMKVLGIQFYLSDILSVLLEPSGENRSAIFVQLPTKSVREAESSTVDGSSLIDSSALRPVENMVASSFAVSGIRKVAVVLSESRRKVRLFEMEVEEDEEEEETMDATIGSNRDNDQSVLNISKCSEIE